MSIDKNALFETTKALWPRTISLSDPNATFIVYEANERAVPVEDDWRQVALWAYHQAVGELEERASLEGRSTICPREVGFEAFERWMRSNLNGDDCWLAERAEWEGAS